MELKIGVQAKIYYEAGFVTCPNIPDGIYPMTWQEVLDYYSLKYIDGSTLPIMKLYPEKTIIECAMEQFQTYWPGNYQVEEYYDSKLMRMALRLKFDNPHEEIIWLLKNS